MSDLCGEQYLSESSEELIDSFFEWNPPVKGLDEED